MGLFQLGTKFFRDKQETSVQFIQTWEVRWYSRHGEYHGDVRQEVMVFPDKDSAEEFKKALVDAFKLIKHTSLVTVSIEENSH
jgi:hypothetical protein